MSEPLRTVTALKKVSTETKHLIEVYEAGDQTLGRKVDQMEGVIGVLIDGFTEFAIILAELESRGRALDQLDGSLDRTVRDVKKHFQKIQKSIWAGVAGDLVEGENEAARKNVRAEFDALWTSIEVVAQVVDGSDRVTIRDYYKH